MTQLSKWATPAKRIAQDYTMAPSCAERIEVALLAAEQAGLSKPCKHGCAKCWEEYETGEPAIQNKSYSAKD